MVIGEVVLSAVLLVLSALTIRSVVNSQLATLGYHAEGVFTARFALNDPAYDPASKQVDFYRELMRRLETRGEIASAAVASLAPTWGDRTQVEIEGKPRSGPTGSGLPPQFASRSAVSGNYFATLGIPVVSGRTFDERDTSGSLRVAVVSTKFAERHWPRENPLGKRFVYGLGLNVKPDDWCMVVGIVSPTLQSYQRGMIDVPQTYVPFTQVGGDARALNVFVRARNASAAATLAPVLRTTGRELDADEPIIQPQTLATMVANARFMKGLIAWIFGIFGGVALILAAVGLYGVMSYSVSQRTQEIGVRMALGAESGDVVAMILREGGARLGIGLAVGLVAAYFAGQLLAFILYGVEPGDPVAFAGTLAVLGATGFVACLVPALRAVRVNPVEALRSE
jgi:putative ABC transport system permease protein